MTLIWPMSIYIPNFRQISSIVTDICRKNTNLRWRLLPFLILLLLIISLVIYGQYLSVYQLWPKYLHWRPRYGQKSWWVTGVTGPKIGPIDPCMANIYVQTKFGANRSKNCWDTHVYVFSRWRPFAILDLFTPVLNHPRHSPWWTKFSVLMA